MMTALLLALFALLGLGLRLLARRLARRRIQDLADQIIAEFQVLLPGRCMLCSLHQYGMSAGHITLDTPVPDHHCCEAEKDKTNGL